MARQPKRKRPRPSQPAPSKALAAAAASWPILRAYVPLSDAWFSTGLGSAAIIRQEPGTDRAAWMCIVLDLSAGGIQHMFGRLDSSPQEAQKLLTQLKYQIPPMQEGPPDLAARYIWGAYAWSNSLGYRWDAGSKNDGSAELGLVPRLPGTPEAWREQFLQHDITPVKLARMLEENPSPDDMPEGKALLLLTTMHFALADHEQAIRDLTRQQPDFIAVDQDGQTINFDWSRAYPKGHWSPLASLGGRQSLGNVRISPGKLVAEVKTLSMGTILVHKLKELLGDRMHHEHTDWVDGRDLFKRAKDSPGQ